MNLKISISSILALVALYCNKCVVEGRILAGNQGGNKQHQEGRNGNNIRDRPFNGPNGNTRPGFPGGWENGVEPVDLMCDASYDCTKTNRRGATQFEGKFVCRTRHNPITNETHSRAMCMPENHTKTGDVCGCCGEDCPDQPEFEDLTCDPLDLDANNITLPPKLVQRLDGEDVTMVCRDLINPFTGQEVEASIPVPISLGLADDECGCCDGVSECPPPPGERQVFERPDNVVKTCDAVDEELIPCNVTRRSSGGGNGGGQSTSMTRAGGDTFETVEGLFVCRQVYNARTGNTASEALCIPPDRAWDTDECGCCGEECPEKPAPVDIDCDDTCQLRNGDQGVFVCRSLFHPATGEERDHSMCIRSDRAWVTDQCSCCEEGCPNTPVGGFSDEDTQLLSLALGVEDEFAPFEENTGGESSASAYGITSVLILLVSVASSVV